MQETTLNKELIFARLKRSKSTLEKYGVDQMGLFGSFARDEGRDNSDIDFLVDFKPGMKTFDNVMELSFFLTELFQRKVEILTRKGLSPYIGPRIMNSVEYVPFAD